MYITSESVSVYSDVGHGPWGKIMSIKYVSFISLNYRTMQSATLKLKLVNSAIGNTVVPTI